MCVGICFSGPLHPVCNLVFFLVSFIVVLGVFSLVVVLGVQTKYELTQERVLYGARVSERSVTVVFEVSSLRVCFCCMDKYLWEGMTIR